MVGKSDTSSATLEAKTSLEMVDVLKKFQSGFAKALENSHLVKHAFELSSKKAKVVSEDARTKVSEGKRLIVVRIPAAKVLPTSLFVLEERYVECKDPNDKRCTPSGMFKISGPMATSGLAPKEARNFRRDVHPASELNGAYEWNLTVTPESSTASTSAAKFKTKVSSQLVLNGALFTRFVKQLHNDKKLSEIPDDKSVKDAFLRLSSVLISELANPKLQLPENLQGQKQANVQ